jgi:hypothetical protein
VQLPIAGTIFVFEQRRALQSVAVGPAKPVILLQQMKSSVERWPPTLQSCLAADLAKHDAPQCHTEQARVACQTWLRLVSGACNQMDFGGALRLAKKVNGIWSRLAIHAFSIEQRCRSDSAVVVTPGRKPARSNRRRQTASTTGPLV